MNFPLRQSCLRVLLAFLLTAICIPVCFADEKPSIKLEKLILNPYEEVALKTFDAIWNQLNHFHFDQTYNGNNWNEVKTNFRPKAGKAKNADELRPILQKMLDLLGQSHMSIIPGDVAAHISSEIDTPIADGHADPGLGVRFLQEQFLISSVRPNSPASEEGIEAGFVLLAINGKNVSQFVKDLPETASPTHRELFAWKFVNAKLRGPVDSEVKLKFDTGKGEKTFTVTRELAPGQSVKLGNFPEISVNLESRQLKTKTGRTVGYIYFNFWMLPTALKFNEVIEKFRQSDGIIIDLRGNLGGLAGMVMGVAGHFMKDPVSFGTMKMRDNELQFRINPRLVDTNGNRVEPYAGPVAILIDSMSVSASELFAFGMQEVGRAKVFGLKTSGQALPSVTETLPNGDVFYHPFADFISAKGTRIEGRGVVPDVEVPCPRQALLSGKDCTLEAALEWLGQTDARLSTGGR